MKIQSYLSLFFLAVVLVCCGEDEKQPIVVTEISPSIVFVGDTVTITGQNFEFDSKSSSVSIGSASANVISSTATEIKVVVPADASTEKVTIHLANGDGVSTDVVKVLHILAGGYTENSAGTRVATFWKDGKATLLADGSAESMGLFVTMNAGSVYVSGYERKTGTVGWEAKYWKDGQAVSLGVVNAENEAIGMAFAGGDIYACGNEYMPDQFDYRPKYWKNGIQSYLSDVSHHGVAYGIHISGSDVYVGGTMEVSSNLDQPVYWKNGVLTVLSSDGGVVFDIESVGGHLFMSGATSPGLTGNRTATYWKDNTANSLDGNNATARALAVEGENIYTGGVATNTSGKFVAKVWKNRTGVELTDGTRNGYVFSIDVEDENIIAGGEEFDVSGKSNLRMWKNNKLLTLPVTSGNSGIRSVKLYE